MIDPYSPPSREAEGPPESGDDPESVDPVVTELRKSGAPALAVAALAALGAMLFGGCAAYVLGKERSVGAGLYFTGLAFGCFVPSLYLFRQWQKVRDLRVDPSKQKVLEVLETANSALRAAALSVVLVVLVTAVLVLVLMSGPRWD